MNKGLKKQVENILLIDGRARSNDTYLIIKLYQDNFYLNDDTPVKKLYKIMKYAKPDDIVKIRRRFNQLGLYKTDDENVVKGREENIEITKNELGYNTEGAQKAAIANSRLNNAFKHTNLNK